MKRLIILAGLVYANLSFSQSEVDALRYSQITFGGTARYNAMSGAFGALGADFSTLSSNPAGIAMYRKSEFSFTPSLFNQTTTSSYNGTSGSDNKYNFNFGNVGFVGAFNAKLNEDAKGWNSFSFGFGYNRLANFHNRYNIEGPNTGGSSLSDIYLRNANGASTADLDPFNEGLAFNTYLIDSIKGNNSQYFSYVPIGEVRQKKTIETAGSMGETVITFGGNYDNKFYIGGTIGIDHISYSENSTYSETGVKPDTISGFKSFSLDQKVSTRGTGINVKLGMIYRITDWVLVGAAFHSQTAFSMHDDYENSMKTNFVSGSYTSTSPSGSFDYSLVTPPKAIGSIGFVIAKRGLIGFDYEIVDYTYARLSSTPNVFTDANDQTRKKYTASSNIRVGAEIRIAEPFTIRGGFALYGNPYSSNVNTDASRMSYSGGIGFREKNYFIDFSYVMTQYKENYYLYDPTGISLNPVHNAFSASSFLMTFGVKF